MSEVKTDKISPRTASGTLTVGDSGDTLTVPSGVTFNAAVTGSGAAITALNATNLASGTVPTARLGSSGTASATTFLRGDNAWAEAGGDNTPRFFAYFGSNEANPSDSTWTTIQYDTEDIDTDSAFDTSAYSFTVPVGSAGVYYLRATFKGGTTVTTAETGMRIRKDSTDLVNTFNNFKSNIGWSQQEISCIATLAEGDVITAQLFIDGTSGTIFYNGLTQRYTNFFGFKLL